MQTDTEAALAVLTVLLVSAVVFWWWRRKRVITKAAGMAKSVFPVWAALGPFDSGKNSAVAMRYAFLACGIDFDEEALNRHQIAYDRNPEGWEENRRMAIEHRSEETELYVTVARSIEASELLDLDIVEQRYREVLQRSGDEQELAILTTADLKIRGLLSERDKN